MRVRGLLLRRRAVVAAPLALTCRVSSFYQHAIAATASCIYSLDKRDIVALGGAGARKNFLVRALVALAPRRVRLVREAARAEAYGLTAAR